MRRVLTAGLSACLTMLPAITAAEVSANIGWVSEYYFRGVPQKTSSASAGIDLDARGFYLGSWAADVGDGAEVDIYGGYLWESGDFRLGAGATGYLYTGDFDDTYKELNLYAGYGPISAEFALGEYDNFGGPRQDYRFFAITAEHQGFYATFGSFGKDFSGEYVEAGYGFEVVGLDLNIAWIWSDKRLADNAGKDDHTLMFGISKRFSLLD